jgi:hypothetical protein
MYIQSGLAPAMRDVGPYLAEVVTVPVVAILPFVSWDHLASLGNPYLFPCAVFRVRPLELTQHLSE